MVHVNKYIHGVPEKMHRVCHVINVEPFVLGLLCLHQNVQSRLQLTDR